MEHVVQDYYKDQAYLAPTSGHGHTNGKKSPDLQEEGRLPPAAFSHEALGRRIIDLDDEIGAVLEKHDISRDDLKSAFSREAPGSLATLVSSDLDCDRLDYLMRTARHAGLPYGSVDAEYIIGQTCVDSDGYVCLTDKALRAVDHLLVSRYFDYTQVVFHKTVVGLEQVLRNVIAELLQIGLIDCSGQEITRMIKEGQFAYFDDHYLIERLRSAIPRLGLGDEPLKLKIRSVLDRRPPKLVAASERIRGRERREREDHKNLVDQMRGKIREWACDFQVDESLWHLWDISLTMTKIGSHIPVSLAEEGGFEDETDQGVRILTSDSHDPQCKSRLLVEHEFALANQLSNSNLYAIRLYVHLEGNAERSRIEQRIRQDLRSPLRDRPSSPS